MKIGSFTARRQYITAFWLTLIIAIALIVTGVFTPPYAEVDGSILESVGLLFLWPALAFGNKALEEGKVARITKGDATISIGEHPGPEPPYFDDGNVSDNTL